MRALTIRQPWAHAITHHHKTIENRTWNTRHRGPIAIHAATSHNHAAYHDPNITPLGLTPANLTRGAITATATLTHTHPDDGECNPWAMPGHWHWLLTDVRPLPEPIPCTGRLGLWHLPDHIAALLPADAGQPQLFR